MKIISMYLPQFHKVKENDEWWGEGFTEWVAVKQAKKYFSSHYQPHVPLDNNYYNLLEKDTMIWQENLMKKYGIDAQCFYHYYFKDGRKILEKPAENLLRWKDIDIPFCFCWANESWARTWSELKSKNSWANIFEGKKDSIESGILLEQQYGIESDWKEHYNYLRTFFKDERYIKHNGKPIFLIYKSHLISCLGDMLISWNRWAIEDGFKGIYVIGANTNINVEKYLDGILYHEPQRTLLRQNKNVTQDIIKYQYEQLWESLLAASGLRKKTYYGGFVGYDDTPRRGKSGTVVEGSSPKLFQDYLSQLIAKNSSVGNEYVFLNAWNEWGEGMHLEPDTKNGYSYLEAVKYACEHYVEYIEKYKEYKENMNLSIYNELDIYRERVFRYEKYWKVLDAWMKFREQGKNIEKYLLKKQIKKIGIYGVGMMGRHLISELSDSKIKIAYAVDQKVKFVDSVDCIYKPDDIFPKVDAVVITVLSDVEEIIEKIDERIDGEIILLEKMIMDIVENI